MLNVDNWHHSWRIALKNTLKEDWFWKNLLYIEKQYDKWPVFPEKENIFKVFEDSFDDVRVVIVGQDPYHQRHSEENGGGCFATGRAFESSVYYHVPRSLYNIQCEVDRNIGEVNKKTGNLDAWAKQGVLLLNCSLTVRENYPGFHEKRWRPFTDEVIQTISDKKKNVVFMLWGRYAKHKVDLIDQDKHLVLLASHPSPMSYRLSFKGCEHFNKANEYLIDNGRAPINWKLKYKHKYVKQSKYWNKKNKKKEGN